MWGVCRIVQSCEFGVKRRRQAARRLRTRNETKRKTKETRKEQINYNILPIQPILTQHSEVAIEMIVEHLNDGGDMPVLYLDMADVCEIDVDKFQPLLIEYSNSQDAAVRHRLAQLLSNRFSARLRELTRSQQQAKSSEPAAESSEDKYLTHAQRIISRYDQDASGSLQKAEWIKMIMTPSLADVNKDDEITVEEYRDYLMKRAQGTK